MEKINIDIRNFALPAPLTGSIEGHSGFGGIPFNGQEIHQITQKKKEKSIAGYVSEKHLSTSFEKGAFLFIVSGRADGFIENTIPIIEEIKTSFEIDSLEDKLLTNHNHPYRWQLRTYGYIYYLQNGVIPLLRFDLISSRNFKSKTLEIDLDIENYESWLKRRLDGLSAETKIKKKIYENRLKTSKAMLFPFPSPRPGQVDLVSTVEENFNEGSMLLIEAPTGLGKTAGVLYPALKESLSRGQKTVFVTPKNSQHQIAEDAIKLMQNTGSKIKSLTITSKSKMCMKAEVICNPNYCEYAKDYYEKLAANDLVNVVGKIKRLTNKKLKDLAATYTVCPFQLSLEAIDRADVVIGDYNYVFSPRSLIGRLSEPLMKPKQKANLIVDEAHNLPGRAQDYFSPSISVRNIEYFESLFAKILSGKHLDNAIGFSQHFISLVKSYRGNGESSKILINADEFSELNSRVRDFTSDYLESDVEILPGDPILGFANLVSQFVDALELTGDEFFHTYQKLWNDEMLKVTCCDASKQLKLAYKEFKNTAAFSATLKPFSYYQQLMGMSEDKTKTFEFSSPFLKNNKKVMVIPQISTKYKDRIYSAPKICDVIERVINLRPGNYIALFPSFEFMNMVAAKINTPGRPVLVQQKEMKLNLIKDYLVQMSEGHTPTLILGVQGGVFSEGIDYPGEMLIGAFIVGPALPTFDFEREQIRLYFEKIYGHEHAFNYAYIYPAMAKAIQSAGRVVRTETDRGIIILIDPRFLESSYSRTMPSEWFENSPKELVSNQILLDIKNFWEASE